MNILMKDLELLSVPYQGIRVESIGMEEHNAVINGLARNGKDIIMFEGATMEELIQDFHDAVDDYMDLIGVKGE